MIWVYFSGFAMGEQCVGIFSVVIMVFAIFALGMDIAALVVVILILVALKDSAENEDKREHAARGRWNELIERLVISKKSTANSNNVGPTPVESSRIAFA